MERLPREALKGAPYNPRKITRKAREKLKRALADVGLLAPVTWNRRSGNVVGGHQRLAALDALEGTSAYLLDVAVVDLDEKAEKTANVALNNLDLSADWDIDALGVLLKDIGQDAASAGFDDEILHALFDGLDDDVAKLLDAPQDPMLAEIEADIRATQEHKQERVRGDKEKIAQARAAIDAARSEGKAGDGTETFVTLTFDSTSDRDAFVRRVGGQVDDRYVSGYDVSAMLQTPEER